jgi:hypothetical protein
MKKLLTLITVLLAFNFSNNNAKAQVYADVAPIFYAHCTSCHHEGQHAPPMMNYSETVAQLYAMTGDLTSGKMPPWPPDTTYTRLVHERLISDNDRNAILTWIGHGFAAGDTTLAPPAPAYAQYQLNGTPDLILQIPAFASNATATADAYDCFSLPTGLMQDRILRAYEIVAGNSAIVHHVVVNVDSNATTTSDLSGGCYSITGDFGIGGWAPGSAPTVYPGVAPLKAGIRIKAGSKLVLQLHYPMGSGGQMDSTQIRLYFYPVGTTGVRTIYSAVPMQNWALNIPANTTRTFGASYAISNIGVDVSLFSVFPHSHKICTSLVNFAALGTDTIPLIRINQWRFDWQGYYTFPNLKRIPSTYTLYSSHFYDNTSANLSNPFAPPHNVLAGTSTTDEMLFDAVQFLVYQPGDELINVEDLLAHDPLLAGVNELADAKEFQTYIYPNPATDKVNIYLSKKSEYKIRLFNVTGQSILESLVTDDVASLDVSPMASGLYLIQITDTRSHETTTKKLMK